MIEVRDLTKTYGPVHALRGISFSVPQGQVVGLLGPNGAGKTTTMKILTGYLAPTSGSATVGGFDVVSDPLPCQRKIGYLPEGNPLYGEMRADEVLKFSAEMHGLRGAARDRAIDEAVEAVALKDKRRRTTGTMSRGERQRVGLAQALLHKPEVLILDEPTSGLDPNQQSEMRALIRSLGRERTVILSTHILPEVEAVCDRALIISQGQIVADGTVEEIRQRARGKAAIVAVVRATPEQAMAAFGAIPGVEAVETTTVPDDSHVVRVRVVGSADRSACERVAAKASESGLALSSLQPDVASLERIFGELTAGGEDAEVEEEAVHA